MDEQDLAADFEEKILELAISKARTPPLTIENGACLNCAEPLPGHRRYCDQWCAEDHSRRVAIQRRQRGD